MSWLKKVAKKVGREIKRPLKQAENEWNRFEDRVEDEVSRSWKKIEREARRLWYKNVDYFYTVYAPVVGKDYLTTIKANGSKKSQYPLEVTAFKGLKQNFANGASSSNNMKSILKSLRSVYNLGISRKLPTYHKVSKEVKTLDIVKIEKHYGSKVVDISDSVYSDGFNTYLRSVSNGEINSVDEFFGEIANLITIEAKDTIVQKNGIFIDFLRKAYGESSNLFQDAIKGNYIYPQRVIADWRPWYDLNNTYYYNPSYISNFNYEYLGNNKFKIKATLIGIEVSWIEYSDFDMQDRPGNASQTGMDELNEVAYPIEIEAQFPQYASVLFNLIDQNKEFRIVKLGDGRVELIFMDDNKFFTTFTKKIEFSPILALKGIHLDAKASKYTNLIRERLGLQEKRFKKKNRENKLFENLQGNEKILNAELGFYLDLFPFKNRAFRNNRDAQLYLKGIMNYFARLSGVPSKGGVGFVSIPVPDTSYVADDSGSGDGIRLNGMTLNIHIEKRFRKTKPKENCFFSTRGGNILLHLVYSDGDKGYIEYILNYTYFYRGISKNNFSKGVGLGLSANDTLFAYINKNLFDELMNVFIRDIVPYISIDVYRDGRTWIKVDDGNTVTGIYTFPLIRHYKFNVKEQRINEGTPHQRTEKIDNNKVRWEKRIGYFRYLFELSASGSENDIDPYDVLDGYSVLRVKEGKNFWENTRDYNESEICWENSKDITENYFSTQDTHPRLPMPIGLWDSIPYRGKLLAYNFSVLVRTHNKEVVRVRRGWTKYLGAIIAVIAAVVAAVTGQYYLIALVGLGLTAVGVVFKVDWLVTIGVSITIGGTVAYVGQGVIGGNLGSILTEMVASPMFYLGVVSSVATNLYGMSLENKIKGIKDELDSKQKEWEKEKSDRMNYTGGINKTSSGGDEDFDAYYNMVDQETLFNIIDMTIDTEKNSQVFDDTKYDNTRVI